VQLTSQIQSQHHPLKFRHQQKYHHCAAVHLMSVLWRFNAQEVVAQIAAKVHDLSV
jgi:hypothetical protein